MYLTPSAANNACFSKVHLFVTDIFFIINFYEMGSRDLCVCLCVMGGYIFACDFKKTHSLIHLIVGNVTVGILHACQW
jgi:hypothetical protein